MVPVHQNQTIWVHVLNTLTWGYGIAPVKYSYMVPLGNTCYSFSSACLRCRNHRRTAVCTLLLCEGPIACCSAAFEVRRYYCGYRSFWCIDSVWAEAGSKTQKRGRKQSRDQSGIFFPRRQLRAEGSLRGQRTVGGGLRGHQLVSKGVYAAAARSSCYEPLWDFIMRKHEVSKTYIQASPSGWCLLDTPEASHSRTGGTQALHA